MSKKIIELRVLNPQMQVKGRKLQGYASSYEKVSNDLGGFKEIIKQGAFKLALAGDIDVTANINHDENLILSRSSAGLNLIEDSQGLKFDFDIPATTYGNDLIVNLEAGNVRDCSFAFVVDKDIWTTDHAGYPLREIHSIKSLEDIAIVTKPAYNDTTVALRNMPSKGMDSATKERIAIAGAI